MLTFSYAFWTFTVTLFQKSIFSPKLNLPEQRWKVFGILAWKTTKNIRVAQFLQIRVGWFLQISNTYVKYFYFVKIYFLYKNWTFDAVWHQVYFSSVCSKVKTDMQMMSLLLVLPNRKKNASIPDFWVTIQGSLIDFWAHEEEERALQGRNFVHAQVLLWSKQKRESETSAWSLTTAVSTKRLEQQCQKH